MNRKWVGFFTGLITLWLITCFLTACGSNVDQASFNKIKTGMTQEEVKAILGSPTESSSMAVGKLSGTASEWKSKEGTITIQFINGKVKAKQFAKSGG
jgi:hypothetical protein